MPKLKVNSKNFMKSNRHPLPPPRQRAQAYALDALIYLAKDEEEMGRFLGETGFDPADLRKMAEDPGFAGAMLDYLCSHESLLVAFGRAHAIDPLIIESARQFLAQHPSRDFYEPEPTSPAGRGRLRAPDLFRGSERVREAAPTIQKLARSCSLEMRLLPPS
ncbi:MAG: DUF3572 domain-containing protein, partial [Hyphomicrobiales bacterium]|nr:DUF3572 domain-containing protein [Hyphomicrobiales bacterium]